MDGLMAAARDVDGTAYNETIHGLDGLGACFQDVREGIIGMLLSNL
jgi:hypothetical protein